MYCIVKLCFYNVVKSELPALCHGSGRVNIIAHFPTNCTSNLRKDEKDCLKNSKLFHNYILNSGAKLPGGVTPPPLVPISSGIS
jgi:hypothetical protein